MVDGIPLSAVVEATHAIPHVNEADPIRVVLADDHQVVRAGLRVLLDAERRFTVVGEAGDAASTRSRVAEHEPGVLVLDLNLGGESGLDLIPDLCRDHPNTEIVVLTMQENPAFAQAALRAGAAGYVLKDAVGAELMDAISTVAAGGSYLNPQIGAKIAALSQSAGQPDRLTPREQEVLRLIALGHTNPEIAMSLTLSVRTVESHRAHIQQKTGLTSRAELVAYARDHELLS
jgi:two-component system response regulator NreC